MDNKKTAGLHESVLHSIERLRRKQHDKDVSCSSNKKKQRLALWDVRPLDRKNAQYIVQFLQQGDDQEKDNDGKDGSNKKSEQNTAVIVTQLVLAYCDLSLEAVQILSAYFEEATHLEKVTLSHVRGLGGHAANVRVDDVAANHRTAAAVPMISPLQQLLAALQDNASVRELCLDNALLQLLNHPHPPQGRHDHQAQDGNNDNSNALGELLQSNRHVTTLSCSTTQLGLEGAVGMQSGLFYNDMLQELDLTDCHIGNEGVDALVRALVGRTSSDKTTTSSKSRLQVLSLAHNQITSRGLPSLARLLKQSKYLKKLILRSNRGIMDQDVHGHLFRGAAAFGFAQGRQPPMISAQECRKVFAKALSENTTLILLSLSDCSVRGSGAAMIVHALEDNTTLEILEMDGFRLDSDAHVCRQWQVSLPRIKGLRHLSIYLDFGRNVALLASLHKNLSLESISRQRGKHDAASSSSTGSSNNSNGGGSTSSSSSRARSPSPHRRLTRSNSIGSDTSAASSGADDAVYSVLERNRLLRLAEESFGIPPPLPPPTDIARRDNSTSPTASVNHATAGTTPLKVISPGMLLQSILRVCGTDKDAVIAMNGEGMASVVYHKIIRPRINTILSSQQPLSPSKRKKPSSQNDHHAKVLA